MGETNCKVYRSIARPERTLVEKFKGIPASNLADCMQGEAVSADIRPLGSAEILGTALTVKVTEGDNLMLHCAMDLIQEGDVVVINAGGKLDKAIFGEMMASYMAEKGAAGIIIDGACRDKAELAALSVPVYTKGVTPNAPSKNQPGEVNTQIFVGGQAVCPGDIVVADEDGIVFVKPEEAEDVLLKAKALMEKEERTLKAIAETGTFDRPWVMENLKALGCEFYD